MKPEYLKVYGEGVEQEVSKLLESLSGMADIIQASLSIIKNTIE
jgi:hypothetical protein